jgi:hypothetical protein
MIDWFGRRNLECFEEVASKRQPSMTVVAVAGAVALL